MNKIKLNAGRRSVRLYRKVNVYWSSTSYGTSRETAGTRCADIELLIDVEKLVLRLLGRTMYSKGRRARVQDGSIVLRVVPNTEHDEVTPHTHNEHCYKDGAIACGH